METVFAGAMQMTYTPDKGERLEFCTIDGLTMLPGAALGNFTEGTSYPMTLEDGVLHTTLTLLADAEGEFSLTFFQTEDSSMYANLEYNDGKNALKTTFLLVPME